VTWIELAYISKLYPTNRWIIISQRRRYFRVMSLVDTITQLFICLHTNQFSIAFILCQFCGYMLRAQ
jgi:hypothetical protein